MADRQTGWNLLLHGDALRRKVQRDRSTVAAVAADANLPTGLAHKAYWLAGAYDARLRRKLGAGVLKKLSAMHLEVVARCDHSIKEHHLRSAAVQGLTARDLQKLVCSERGSARGEPTGTIDSLKRSTHAMKQYMEFDDRSLRTLLSGPNGAEVRQVASAGRVLADRLAVLD
jgi:hypothetical protein